MTPNPRFVLIAFTAAACLTGGIAASAEPARLGRVLTDGPVEPRLQAMGSQAERVEVDVYESDDGETRLRAVSQGGLAHPWGMQLIHPNTKTVMKDDVLLCSFKLRTLASDHESGEAQIEIMFELGGEPYTKSIRYPASAGGQWQRFDVPFRSVATYAPGEARFIIRPGLGRHTLEITGLRLENLGPDADFDALPRTQATYRGRAADAPWRAEAAERIERLRKADLALRVTDAAGQPVPDADVTVRMTRHGFLFGTAINGWTLLRDPSDQDGRRYRQTILELFNGAVHESSLKWANFENDPSIAMRSLQWMLDHDLTVRGHTMVWPGWRFVPERLRAYEDSPEKLQEEVAKRIATVGKATRGKMRDWDVVNEPIFKYDMLDVVGGPAAMADWFRQARAADPDVKLYLNETSVPTTPAGSEIYDQLLGYVKLIEDDGAPIDGIGLQGHFGWSVTPPAELITIFDHMSSLGHELKITEFDVAVSDEQLQADYLRDFYTAAFSHPAMTGILMWGFWEGKHWAPQAALFRKDWTEKPAAKAYRDLVLGEWWTQLEGRTDEQGRFAGRGFLGDYEAVVTVDGVTHTQPFTLTADSETVSVMLP